MEDAVKLNVPDAIHLASGLFDDGLYERAAELYRAAEQGGGGYPAINGLGICLSELERPAEALAQFDQAYAILRDEMIALASNRGRALTDLGRCDEALLIFDGLIRSAPSDLFRHNRALTLLQMGHYRDAIKACDDVLSREPDNGKARFARGFAYLVLGDYERGFADYECRLKDDIAEPGVPLWTGSEDLRGRTILAHSEMGLGDNIMFMRYVPLLVERGARVIVVIPESQRFLIDGIPGAEYRSADRATWPQLDYWVRFMSLGWCFRTTAASVPPPVKLAHDPIKLEQWRRSIDDGNQRKIGLCWSGSRKSRYDSHRSMPLSALAPLFKIPHCTIFSLQKDLRDEDRAAFAELKIIDLAPKLDTFADTAAAMANLDLVLTVDTSVAHMAGTVGVPTWVMLTAFRTYWLWVQNVETSPWYPSVRVFRQQKDGEWSGVVNRIHDQLTEMNHADLRPSQHVR